MTHNTKFEKQEDHFMPIFWMYTGAFLFSIILLIFTHELGHYFAFRQQGYDAVRISITPFFGTTTSSQEIQTGDAVFIILGGTVFNLTVASCLAIILRRIKTPYLIPLKMYPIMAFLIEGMVILGGLFFDETITDFAMLIQLGWPPIWVGMLGFILIIIGGYLSYEIWALHGIHQGSSPKKLLLLNSQYVFYWLAGYLVSQMILPVQLRSVKEFLAICMVLQWLYLGFRILIAPSIFSRLIKKEMELLPKISLQSSMFSLILGSASWFLSFFVLN